MSFYRGQKVMCIDDKPRGYWATCEVKRGEIYTIRAIDLHPDLFPNEYYGLYLEEIVLQPHARWPDWEPSFFIGRFRPLVEHETDISIFKMLETPVAPKQLERV